jgi:ribosomal protein S6--L-glutamate ligase
MNKNDQGTKKALITTSTPYRDPRGMNWFGLRNEIRRYLDKTIQVDMTALSELIFDISLEVQKILYGNDLVDVLSYDAVVVRNAGKNRELAIALNHVLQKNGVPVFDSYIDTIGMGKLSSAALMQRYNIPTPRTIFRKANYLEALLKKNIINYPAIVKADLGRKGKDNFSFASFGELKEILESSRTNMIIQEYIPNNGDYRALVLGDSIKLLIHRKAISGSHLNNTSQGGESKLVDIGILNKDVRDDILKAAKISGLQVAGVDVIIDKTTGKHYILEVNAAPQIGTGSHIKEKIKAYSEWIKVEVIK